MGTVWTSIRDSVVSAKSTYLPFTKQLIYRRLRKGYLFPAIHYRGGPFSFQGISFNLDFCLLSRLVFID